MLAGRRIVSSGAESLVLLPLDPYVVEVAGALPRDAWSVLSTLRGWSGDVSVQAQLRGAYADLAPHGGGSATFEEMAAQVAARVGQGGVRAYKVHDVAGAAPGPVAFKSGDDAAVPFTDDAGKPVLTAEAKPMMRPAGLPPSLFVDQGRADGKAEQDMVASGGEGGGAAALGYMTGALAKFKQGAAWDAQRVGGRFHAEFRDYATVVIGVYAASSQIAMADILTVQNSYAAVFSRFAPGTAMDGVWKHLPARNVFNTRLGFQLVRTGRLGSRGGP